VPLTVILELEWVLRAFYGFAAEDFVRVSNTCSACPTSVSRNGRASADALAWHAEGLDFADALHLLASSHCTEFMSFDDRRFARRAKRLGVTPAVVVPGDVNP
jgi:predicted nucleic acid-binding protein